jgi:hypothetical protein
VDDDNNGVRLANNILYSNTITLKEGVGPTQNLTLDFGIVYAPRIILPIRLASFTAQAGGCQVMISWKANVADNIIKYLVQRSTDGISFGTIDERASEGNNASYTVYDHQPMKGKNFYRLQMVSANGNTENSDVTMATVNCNPAAHISLYPTVTESTATVAGLTGTETIRITDMNGRLIWESKANGSSATINVSRYAAGSYNVTVYDANKQPVFTGWVIRK